MEKKRIYQVAKDFHVSSEALVSMLKDLGYEVKSHMSIVDDKMFKSINEQFKKQHAEAVKDIQKKKKISEAISSEKEQKKPSKIPKASPIIHKKKKHQPKLEPIPQEKDKTEKKIKKHSDHGKKSRSKARKQKIFEHQVEVHDSFKKTMASIASDTKSKTRRSRPKQSLESAGEKRPLIKVSEYVSVAELAKQMDVAANLLIAKLVSMGIMVTINKTLEMDTIVLLADEFGYDIEPLVEYAEDILKTRDENAVIKANLIERPPVVTVMGHVDHGKTTLLDYIRKTNVVSGESGGITQHIGAYSVKLQDGQIIAFIDTPGHEAFTAMRARGASVTDIVILVVASDDGVMPQTIEAINHAKAANIPIIIAINKIDLPNADPEKIKGELSRHNILVEDWGGNYQCQEISAKNGININKLLEKVLLEAEMLELMADSTKSAAGVIIDSRLDKGRGPVATILVHSGVMRVGDAFITGMITGRVRAIHDENGKQVESAGPSVPVQIFGMNGVPKAGDTFYIIDSESEAKEIANQRRIIKREQESRQLKNVTLEDVYEKIKDGL
ncbi:translation initiation factor IF-2, partial [Candidatus Latescibacterota bacterium]